MKRWTKKVIRELRSQLEGFVLFNEMYAPRERIETFIAENRLQIVENGLEAWRKLLAERATSSLATSEHYKKMAPIWKAETLQTRGEKAAEKSEASALETSARFAQHAVDEEKAVTYVEKLLARVRAEGLPPEVASYTPRRGKGPRGWDESA